MKLENRLPAEGINASHEHPLGEFAWLVGGVLLVVVVLVVAASYCAQWIAPRIPFEYELKLARGIDLARTPATAEARAAQAELQALADRLAARMGMPAAMNIRIGYHDSDAVNAFATLGGQAVVFRGLLAKVESEDALAMVIAHELAHLKHRHPAAALGRGVAVGLMMSVVSAEIGRSLGGTMLGQAGMMTMLTFNRRQEREADEEALRAIAAEYGHVGGALELFDVFMRESSGRASRLTERSIPGFLRTHPLTAARMQAVHDWAHAGGKAIDGPRRPLPAAIAAVAAQARARAAQPGEQTRGLARVVACRQSDGGSSRTLRSAKWLSTHSSKSRAVVM